ncbi:DNA cytosine methyltransferase [Pasteurella multocida]|uniref:DNA cytosine methyltransferase n=1 Tax=Pasteurella multocida TaxID=747 RepID=UPI0007ED2192|nr:DNA cytosine methyltransferase [Pasteurella multocida]MCL7822652.1 DNA cytosine methyltransferase [Pasteurella multocida]MDY0577153.1 DNA cytosine methyltransferase [Pasteurella multocida]MEB3501822.1 DNA cytosine methyltransferase [Pasteurella multocida]OBP35868.1 cytosine methyltransferase [Pasteurella multocida subsp. multocida]URH97377.1 DNA cytosine methyltransferase [Pasteurella multocida]
MKKFTYGSVCSGIEAVTCAWHEFAEPLWFSEIEQFPSAVLAYHYPKIPNLGDMTELPQKILDREIPAPDVLVGGTPCQAFSVAGNRQSLDDERGNLTLVLIKILEAIDYVRFKDNKPPCILVWENVPGVLSTSDNAFGHLLAGLVQECEPLQHTGRRWTNAGYVHSTRTICWRVLDAQYFGVAQRRKRVFLVASARKRSVAQILIESKSVRGNIEQSGTQAKDTAAFIETSFAQYRKSDVAGTLRASGGVLAGGSETFVVHGSQDPIISKDTAHCIGRNGGLENILFEVKGEEACRIHDDISPTLKARMGTGGNNVPCVALAGNTINRSHNVGGNGNGFDESGVSYTLTSTDVHAISTESIVRKLTPRECERLQGFPDDYTKIPYRNKSADECPDSPRYKAIGNSMAVPVMKWIGLRLINYINQYSTQ